MLSLMEMICALKGDHGIIFPGKFPTDISNASVRELAKPLLHLMPADFLRSEHL